MTLFVQWGEVPIVFVKNSVGKKRFKKNGFRRRL
jgi:hypothetical protein